MTISDDIFTRLAEPFDPSLVSWRVGSTNKKKFESGHAKERKGQALAFIDARDVMRRLDDAVGPGLWEVEYPHVNPIIICRIGIEIDGRLRWKANGAGQTDIEGEKGGSSDAFKRAAVLWGIGQYLYDVKSPWLVLDEWWQIQEADYAKLRRLLPNAKSAYRARKDGDFERITGLLRACVNLEDLQHIWKAEQKLIASWPDNWQEHVTEEKDRIKADLMARQAA